MIKNNNFSVYFNLTKLMIKLLVYFILLKKYLKYHINNAIIRQSQNLGKHYS